MNNFFGGDLCEPYELYRVLVDVDLTIVDSLTPWIEWFNEGNLNVCRSIPNGVGPAPFMPISKECYMAHAGDLAILMRERAHPGWIERKEIQYHIATEITVGNDPMDFWRNPYLYSRLDPLPGAIEFLTNLKSDLLKRFNRVEIVAVSKCEPEHERSKRKFVYERFEGLFDGFISTDEKHMIAGDVLIDDNPKYVQPCIDNQIFSIFVPQGNYEKLDLSNCNEMLYIKHQEGKNHFDFLNSHRQEVVEMLIHHYNYVR